MKFIVFIIPVPCGYSGFDKIQIGFWAQGDFSVDAPCTRLTKYRETAEHEEGKVTDPMHLSTQSLNL